MQCSSPKCREGLNGLGTHPACQSGARHIVENTFVERQNVERHIVEKQNVETLFGRKAYLVEN